MPDIVTEATPVWFDFTNLFAWCDLHATRWYLWDRPNFFAQGRARFYDRQGFPIPGDQGPEWKGSAVRKWARLAEDRNYVIVARDDLPDGGMLSTVWFGFDRRWDGRPIFFETARFDVNEERVEFPDIFAEVVFGDAGKDMLTTELSYGSEEEALAGHHEVLRRIRLKEGH